MTDLSIIIVSYNTAKLTKKCINTIISSLSKSKLNIEIILFDNASSDNTVEIIRNSKYEIRNNIKIRIIKSKSNLGFARGNNEAVKQAQGQYLLFLNTDIEVIDDAIPKLFNFFIKQNNFHFVGGKLYNKNMTPQPSAGPFYTLPYVFIWLFLRGDYWGASRNSPDSITRTDWVSGACFITAKAYYNDLGGFDENIFMYMDEVDLFYRGRQKNYKVGFYPDAEFIHLGSASSKTKTQPILQVYQGLLYFYKKNRSSLELILLRYLLKLKARIALLIGKFTDNKYLINTYEEAYKICKSY